MGWKLIIILFLDEEMRPTIKSLTNALSDKVDWYELGIQLDLLPGLLQPITEEHKTVKKRLIAMLDAWLSKYPNQGWSDLVDALRTLNKNDVADKLMQEYCSAPSVTPSPAIVKGTCM